MALPPLPPLPPEGATPLWRAQFDLAAAQRYATLSSTASEAVAAQTAALQAATTLQSGAVAEVMAGILRMNARQDAIEDDLADILQQIQELRMSPRTLTSKPAALSVLEWAVPPLVIAPGSEFDLASTLPPSVVRNGVFSLVGGTFPVGVTMTPRGLLVATTAASGSAAGLVFQYSEPSDSVAAKS